MTAKELEVKLDNYYNEWDKKAIRRRLKSLRSDLQDLYNASGAINYDGMPHSTLPGNPVLKSVIQIDDEPEKIQAEIREKHRKLLEINRLNRRIEAALSKLTATEYKIIYLKFAEGMEFKDKYNKPGIAETVHYCEQHLRKRVYPRILEKILSAI